MGVIKEEGGERGVILKVQFPHHGLVPNSENSLRARNCMPKYANLLWTSSIIFVGTISFLTVFRLFRS